MSETDNRQNRQTEQPNGQATDRQDKDTIVQSSGVTLACPVCGKEFTGKTGKKAFGKVRGHYLGMKDGKHEGSFPYTMEDFGLEEEAITTKRRVKEKIEPLEDALPDALSQLTTLLKEHGIRRTPVVIRAMKLRDPEDLEELMFVLDDLGTNRSRTRRIIEDYSRWLGIKIPGRVYRYLKPHREEEEEEYDSFRRQPQFRGDRDLRDPLTLGSTSETAEVIKALGQYQRDTRPQTSINPTVSRLQDQIDRLQKDLEDERRQRTEDRWNRLENKISNLETSNRNAIGKFDVATQSIRSIENLGREFLTIVKTRRGHVTEDKPPEREVVESSKTAADYCPPEFVELGEED